MRKVVIENKSDHQVSVAIEPWAELEILEPRDEIVLEYEEYEGPAQVELTIENDNNILVGLLCEAIRIKGKRGEIAFGLFQPPDDQKS